MRNSVFCVAYAMWMCWCKVKNERSLLGLGIGYRGTETRRVNSRVEDRCKGKNAVSIPVFGESGRAVV